ncbi:winged helix-turn-helix domain-containing protein [Leucothrix pacifica]|nr:winged helix-turn-helix domain-containing protein [Leucothrix pacifica]
MAQTIVFDPANQILEIAGKRAQVSPKAFAVLTYLHQHHQQLVTKEDLLTAVWPKVFVTDAVLKVAVGELRKVLNDHPKQPQFIETVHRRGYRFIGELQTAQAAQTTLENSVPAPVISTQATTLIARDDALQTISEHWALAQSGQKQLLFISAEAGVGKTALVQAWLKQQFFEADNPSPCLLANAVCFDQHGSGEPYWPVLSALGTLLQSAQADAVKQCLRRYAPSWLLQIPSLIPEQDQAQLKQELFGVTSQRMLREFVDFVDALSLSTPLLLCIEDLHWCDAASLDLIMALAQRQSSARFMLLGSFRSSALQQDESALKVVYSQLTLHQQCQTLPLTNLDEAGVAQWMARALPETLRSEVYTQLFYRYTEGNPLLLTAVSDHLQQMGLMDEQAAAITPEQIEQGISGGLKQLLSLKTAKLSKQDRQVLEAASVSSAAFATESLAAVMQQDVLEIEEVCEDQLLHEQWLAPEGSQSWPDGSISESYRFWHQLYRQYFYENLSAARCRHYHLRFAERLLSGYLGKVSELASQLAYHFEAGGDLPRALAFSKEASQHAAQCFAYREAIAHISNVIALSERLEQPELQLASRKRRCTYLLASGQLGETVKEYKSLIEASQALADSKAEIDATLGMADALFWIDRQACLDAGKRAVALAEASDDEASKIHTKGKLAHFSSVVEGYQPAYAADYEAAFKLAEDSGDVALQCVHYPRHLYYLIIRSRYQQANDLAARAMQLALDNGDAVSYLSCEFFHAWALFYQGQWGEMLEVIEAALALATKNEHRPWVAHFTIQKAWLLLQAGDFEGAKALCQPVYDQAKLMPTGSLYFFSVIILLQLEVALGGEVSEEVGDLVGEEVSDQVGEDVDKAQAYVTEITQRLNAEPNAIDWVLRFPLQQGLAAFYLAREQWSDAASAAIELKTQADSSGELTYSVMADYFLAQSRIGQGNHDEAQTVLEGAVEVLQKEDLPVISWRTYALKQDQKRCDAVIQARLKALESAPDLQRCFQRLYTKSSSS